MTEHHLKPLCLHLKLGSTPYQLCEFLNLCLSVLHVSDGGLTSPVFSEVSLFIDLICLFLFLAY